MKVNVKKNVSWVGKIDWELRKFHGNEYSTHKGSTYNSYLIKEEKNVLIDTVWKPFAKEYVENLEKEIDLNEIDYVIVNHAEIDHSGALPELMVKIPDVPIFCTKKAVESITGHYHKDWNFNVVKTGDTLDIGNGKKIIFMEMKMLHWPDSMASYLTGDNILFSNDAFGQHYAHKHLFNDLVYKEELFTECIKYYANILTPFSKLVSKKIEEIQSLNIPIDIIAPSHGVIWRDNPMQIVQKYVEWSNDYQKNQITLLYDTMWDGTKRMAEAIAEIHHLIDNQSISKMKDGVMIINTSQGELIDTQALLDNLKTEKIGSAGLDVYEEESEIFFEDFSSQILTDDILARFLTFPNVLITSHQAFFTKEALSNIARTTLNNIKDYFEKEEMPNEICYRCDSDSC